MEKFKRFFDKLKAFIKAHSLVIAYTAIIAAVAIAIISTGVIISYSHESSLLREKVDHYYDNKNILEDDNRKLEEEVKALKTPNEINIEEKRMNRNLLPSDYYDSMHFDSAAKIESQDYVDELNHYIATLESKEGSIKSFDSSKIAFIKVNPNGDGICVFNLLEPSKGIRYCSVAKTTDGKNWELANSEFALNEGFKKFAYIDGNLIVFNFNYELGQTEVTSFDSNFKPHPIYKDFVPGISENELLEAEILSTTGKSIVIGWSFIGDNSSDKIDGSINGLERHNSIYIAKYDASMNEINCQFKNNGGIKLAISLIETMNAEKSSETNESENKG